MGRRGQIHSEISPLSRARRRRTPVRLGAALALAGAFIQASLAQPGFLCAPLLPSISRSPAYGRIPGEPRCEGYVELAAAQPYVELLSLTRHQPDSQELAVAGQLQIRANPAVPLRLLIQPLRPTPFYRVDARLAAGQAMAWNAMPMMASTGARLSELGFLAHAASPDPGTPAVAPVSLPPVIADPAFVYAVLRVSVPVASVAARSYRLGDGVAASGAWRRLPGPPLRARDTFVLPIRFAGDGRDVRVDVRAVGANGRPLPVLRFVVVGR
jgi:hypothetical protein